jgi:hypothetical protein
MGLLRGWIQIGSESRHTNCTLTFVPDIADPGTAQKKKIAGADYPQAFSS